MSGGARGNVKVLCSGARMAMDDLIAGRPVAESFIKSLEHHLKSCGECLGYQIGLTEAHHCDLVAHGEIVDNGDTVAD